MQVFVMMAGRRLLDLSSVISLRESSNRPPLNLVYNLLLATHTKGGCVVYMAILPIIHPDFIQISGRKLVDFLLIFGAIIFG